jgi:uncharacterized protein YkwD
MKNKCLLVPCFFSILFVFIMISDNFRAQINTVKYLDKTKTIEKKSYDIASLEYRVFVIINQKRAENGLKALVWNPQAASVARLHSSNMAFYDFFSHIGIDGKRVDDRADSLGLRKWKMIGENIAYNSGFADPVERAVFGWMQSDGHRNNLLRNNWKETGIGISVSANGKFYITQVFLQRK